MILACVMTWTTLKGLLIGIIPYGRERWIGPITMAL
jgi:hypothetical protein